MSLTSPAESAAVEAELDGEAELEGEAEVDGEAELSETDAVAIHLDIYVHADNEEFSAAMETLKSRLAERNEMIAQCMGDRGFDFVGDDPEVVHGYYEGFDVDRNSVEWAGRYGFGITTLIWPQGSLNDLEAGGVAVGHPGRAPKTPPQVGEGETDPLSAYLETLDDPQRYWTALYGANPDPATGAYADTSCAGVAADRVPDRAKVAAEAVLVDSSAVATVLTRLADHEQVVDRRQVGAACLADQGFGFADELDARIAVWELRGALPEQPWEATAEGSVGAYSEDGLDLSSEYLAALVDAQATEVSAALAVWECGVAQAQLNRLKMSILPDVLADVPEEPSG